MSSWLQLSTVMDTLDEMKKATPYISFYFLDIMFGHSGPDVDSEYLYFLKSGLTTQIVNNLKLWKIMDTLEQDPHGDGDFSKNKSSSSWRIDILELDAQKGKISTELHAYFALSYHHTSSIIHFC